MNKLKESLFRKWVLFDTNILLKASRHPQKLLPILKLLQETQCRPVYCELIRAEFLQSVWQPELIEEMETFLIDLSIQMLPMTPMDVLTDEVMNMTRVLRKKKKTLPDLVDSYAAALVKKYKNNLILITSNHKHFAYNLNRIDILPIEISEEEVITIGFYQA